MKAISGERQREGLEDWFGCSTALNLCSIIESQNPMSRKPSTARKEPPRLHSAGLGGTQAWIDRWPATAGSLQGPIIPGQRHALYSCLAGRRSFYYETFDPKPNAPQDIRGDFGTLPSVPGVHFSEAVPHLAKVMDKVSIIRPSATKIPITAGETTT